MNILMLGGTRFIGIHTVSELLHYGHTVTVATRGKTADQFGDKITRLTIDRTDPQNLLQVLNGNYYDVVCDSLAYCSNDVKYILNAVKCGRYITTSSAAVYEKKLNLTETDFNALTYPLKWCGRFDDSYNEIKRQAECALFQGYLNQKAVAVRFPFVIGEDDYTKRLFFYVEHTINGLPMNIDNLNVQMSFIKSDEAGKLIAWLAGQDYTGPLNGCNGGTLSLAEIIDYVEFKTGSKAVITSNGDNAPYNGEAEYSINTSQANQLGFTFTPLKDWIFNLLDFYIKQVTDLQ